MFGKSSGYEYRSLSQRDSEYGDTPGLFSSHAAFTHNNYDQRGHSFDYVPKVSQNDFTDKSQGLLSWICNLIVTFLVFLVTFITFPISGWFVLKVVPNYERIVVFRLGRIRPPKGPGVVLVLPFIDQWQKVDLRTRAFSVPPCKVTTKDGGLVSVGADIQFRIWNPVMSVVAVQDLNASTRLTAQNAMMQTLSKKTLREIQTERIKLGEHLGMDMNEMTKPWGLEVDRVELILEGVLREPDGGHPGPVIMPPSVPGLEGLTGPIQQLAMHFLSQTAASQSSRDSVSLSDELRSDAAVSRVDGLMEAVRSVLSEQLVHQVRACYGFQITSDSGHNSCYYVDLTQGAGACGAGVPQREPDVSLSMSERDLLAMFEGVLRPLTAYSSGRLRVQGDLNTAMKLETLIRLLKTTSCPS
ncbi:LOW QUALITY PROTEIN: stomatin-like protein 1 [Puntigrus tetrazona]|uniref:LOW QUALITY PROTEIN: stomatin-like protein 1 n=1 Tax=Puntigrus tetrazona TaxID=1606681 RepID=UPI001C89B7C7|nr:LOW QUALITY PROTEIN: stomatin-like protein 1 [Puntigrus tetrazona]